MKLRQAVLVRIFLGRFSFRGMTSSECDCDRVPGHIAAVASCPHGLADVREARITYAVEIFTRPRLRTTRELDNGATESRLRNFN